MEVEVNMLGGGLLFGVVWSLVQSCPLGPGRDQNLIAHNIAAQAFRTSTARRKWRRSGVGGLKSATKLSITTAGD